jgi:hypothetical protein
MSSPVTRHRRGAHRGGRTGRGLLAAVMPSALAVVAVAALVTSLAVWRGEDPGQPSASATTGTPSAPSREALSRAPSSSPAGATASRQSAGTRKHHARTASAPPSTAPPSTAPPSTAPRDVEVVVLNQTHRSGLAGSVADVLRGKGWTVPAVGNFRGTVPATTVYYPAGAEAAAQAAAESLPTATRVRPTFGNLSTSRLTVVVTDSYPG